MNILSNSLHIPETGHVTILEKECQLVSLPIPSHYAEGDLTDILAFINSQKSSVSTQGNIPDFRIPLSSPLDVTQAHTSSLFQDVATNTSLSLSGVTETSPFVETDDNPWKRAWLAFRSGRNISSLLSTLSSSLQEKPTRKSLYTGRAIHGLATLLSLCDYVYHMFSPQLGFGLSVSRQLELFSSLPPYPPGHTGSIRCVAWHPYLSLLAMAINDHIIQLQNLHSPDSPLGTLRHRNQQNITCLQFSRTTGSQLAVGCTGGVLVWTVDLSAMLKGTTTYPTKWFPYAPGCPVLSLAWAPNQTLLSSCSSAGRHILLIDTPTGHSQPVSRMATRGICLLEWSPDGSKLLSACCTPEFRVWSAESWTCERWDGMSDRIQTAQWSPDGSLLLFAIRNEPYLYSLGFSGCEGGLDVSLREGVGGSKSAIKCVDLTPLLCTASGGTEIEIGGCIQQVAWDTKGERLALLFSPESTPATQELILILRTKTGPVLSITPVGFIRGHPSSIPLMLSFRPQSDSGATLLVLWNSGYVSLIPFDYSSRVNFETPGDTRHFTSTPLLHTSMLSSLNRPHNTSYPILFSPMPANPSPIFS